MKSLATLTLLFCFWSDVHAWSCGIDVDFKNNLSEKVYIRLNIEFEKFDTSMFNENELDEFVKESRIIKILLPNQLKPVSLGYPCTPKTPEDETWWQPPKELWFSYEVWGHKIGDVVKYEKGLVINIE